MGLTSFVDAVVPVYTSLVAIWCAVHGEAVLLSAFVAGWTMIKNLEAINIAVDAVIPSYCVAALALSYATKPSKKDEAPKLVSLEERAPPGRPHLSGTWRMIPSDDYVAYLEAVGIRPLARRALARIPVLQTIRLYDQMCEITTKTLLSFTTACEVGGPPSKSRIKHDHFQDRIFWETDSNQQNSALVLIKDNLTKGYVVTTKRSLSHDDPNILRAHILIHTHDNSKADAEFIQMFQRTSPV